MPPAPSPGWRDYQRAMAAANRRHRIEINRIRRLHKLSPQPEPRPNVLWWLVGGVTVFWIGFGVAFF